MNDYELLVGNDDDQRGVFVRVWNSVDEPINLDSLYLMGVEVTGIDVRTEVCVRGAEISASLVHNLESAGYDLMGIPEHIDSDGAYTGPGDPFGDEDLIISDERAFAQLYLLTCKFGAQGDLMWSFERHIKRLHIGGAGIAEDVWAHEDDCYSISYTINP